MDNEFQYPTDSDDVSGLILKITVMVFFFTSSFLIFARVPVFVFVYVLCNVRVCNMFYLLRVYAGLHVIRKQWLT